MKELAVIRAQNALLIAKIFAREGKSKVADKATEMKDQVVEKAKIYGKKAQDMAENYNSNKAEKGNILQEYQEVLAEIEREYEDRMDAILEERSEWEEEEEITMLQEMDMRDNRKQIQKSPEYLQQMKQEKALKKEIKQALEQGDLDTVTAKNEELKALTEQNPLLKCDKEIAEIQQRREKIQQVIDMCNEEIEKCEEDRDHSIEEVTEDRDNQLAVVKSNVFQKVAGFIINKVIGLNRFKNKVVDKIKETVKYIKTEKLPPIKKFISGKKEQFLETMRNKKEQLLINGRETLEKKREKKEQLMQKAEDKLRDSVEKGREKKDQRSMDYAEVTADDSLEPEM